MNDAARPIAIAICVVLAAAAGAVIYLGTAPGPSRPGSSPAASAHAPTPAATSRPEADHPAVAGSAATGLAVAGSAAAPPATPRVIPSADLSGDEQASLERLNAVRANPPAYLPAWRQLLPRVLARMKGCSEPASMLDPIATYTARQPLAANQQLTDAARAHGRDMIARRYMEHVNPDGIASNARVIAAGYPLPVGQDLGGFTYAAEKNVGNIESLAFTGVSPPEPFRPEQIVSHIDELVIDACVPDRGHRTHLLSARGRSDDREYEIGLGVVIGEVTEPTLQAQLHTVIEIATRNDGNRYVLGVVYRDGNGNGRYDAGEGLPGVEITIPSLALSTHTAPGGGYALPVPDGNSGEVVAGEARRPFRIAGKNVKLDFIAP